MTVSLARLTAIAASAGILVFAPSAAFSQKQPDGMRGAATMMALASGGSFAPMLERVIPSVVTIRVIGNKPVPIDLTPRGRPGAPTPNTPPKFEEFRAGGSGIVIDAAKGHILTNNHVIEYATEIQVNTSSGRRYKATLIGTDVGSDVAVIQVDPAGLKAIEIGDSDQVRVGDIVAAVGNPFGLEGTATVGIVSATMRTQIGHGAFEDYLQTDAQINPGNSGGALVDVQGRLVGINTVAGGPPGQNVGIGFAIPINMAMTMAQELITAGRVRRGSTGIVVSDIPPEIAAGLGGEVKGAIVTRVVDKSPAAEAGVQPGDIVVSALGKPVRGAREFVTRTVSVPAGTNIQFVLLSRGQGRTVTLATKDLVVDAPAVDISSAMRPLTGTKAADILVGHPRFGEVRGAELVSIAKGSLAERQGLKAGDIVTGVDNLKVRSVDELEARLANVSGEFRLLIDRAGVPAYIKLIK